MAQIKLAEYTFDNSVGDCLPTLTPNTITMTKEDSVNGTITKRIIYIDDATLPTRIQLAADGEYNRSLLTVDYLNIDTNITSMKEMFYGCTNLTYVNTTNWNTTNVTNMYYAFCNTKISEINVTSFNTDKVTNMEYMFGNCSLLRFIDITNFTTRSDTSTGSMFANDNMKVIYDRNKWKAFMSLGITTEKVTPPKHIIAKYKYDTGITSSVTKPTITGISSSSIVTKEVATGVDNINYVIIGYDGTEQPITKISFFDFNSLLTIEYLNFDSNINEASHMFHNCTNLTSINTYGWDTATVTDMSYIFSGCELLSSVKLNNINTSSVTDMSYMFNDCSSLTSLDLSSFETTKTTNMTSMFYGCTGITTLDLTNFDTTNITSSSSMFSEWTLSQTVYIGKKWTIDTSSYSVNFIREVVYKYMIAKYTFNNSVENCLPTITGATTSQWGYGDKVDGTTTTRTIGTDEELTITNISFQNKTSLLTLDYLNFTNAITNATRMFNGCTALTSINALNWDTSNVTSMNAMFNSCTSLASIDMSNWDVGKVTNMGDMFYACKAFTTLDLSAWNVSKVTNINTMFSTCYGLTTLNVSGWDTSSVKTMSSTFTGCSSLTALDLSHFKVDGVTSMSGMFNACSSLTTLNLSTWNTGAVSAMNGMFQGCGKLTALDLSHFNVDSVTNMSNMFNGCSGLTSLNTSNWNTSKVSNMNAMFRNCAKLTALDLSHFKTDGVTNMGDMFSGCTKLTTLDLSHFKVDGVTAMTGMFYNCSALTTLNVSNWNTSKVSSMNAVFQGCANLKTLDLSSWNTSAVSNMNFMFSGCNALTMVDISNFDTSKVTAWGSFNANKLTNIGLVYASSSTINSIVTKWLGTSVARNVYYMDAEPSELTTRANITYVPYSQSILSCSEEITLRSNGDVYDELDLLTGQVIQRIGEDNEILEEEIVRTIELDGEISFYENSYIHTSSNEITPEFEFQPTLTNCYAVSDLKPNTQYTVLFEGNPTLMSLGGTTIENPISKIMITSGEVDNILWFDTPVSKIMILEGDLTNRDVEYFTGVKSSQKIEVQLRGNTPYFAKGGRK